PGIGLGHRRLAIVGIADGQQPMRLEGPDLTIAFNGEIFNFVELRAELEAKGQVLLTGSDTEGLLHLYAEHGETCLSMLNVDFAFDLLDGARNRMLIARDRVGVRPLLHAGLAVGL